MPIKLIDYSNTVIYKIVCNDPIITDIYIGSTCNFANRKWNHKNRCKTSNIKLYKTINDNGGWDNWSMLEIEKFSCVDGNEARTRERYWFEQLNAKLNTLCPNGISIEESKKNTKEYYEKNKDKMKEYYEKNKNKLKENREKNKDKIKENREKTYICACGSIITIPHKNRHEQTNKHKLFMLR
jgi:hypothetical protein